MCGGIYARVYCIFSACTMSSQRKFTFAISSPDEFLVILNLEVDTYQLRLFCDCSAFVAKSQSPRTRHSIISRPNNNQLCLKCTKRRHVTKCILSNYLVVITGRLEMQEWKMKEDRNPRGEGGMQE